MFSIFRDMGVIETKSYLERQGYVGGSYQSIDYGVFAQCFKKHSKGEVLMEFWLYDDMWFKSYIHACNYYDMQCRQKESS